MTPSRRLTATLGTAALVAAVVVAPASLVGRDGAEAGTTRTGPLHLLDVAGRVGLDARHGAFRWGTSADPAAMMGGGVCWLDADRDGWMDLYTVNAWTEVEHTRWLAEEGRLPTSTLHHNDGGTYTDVGEATGAAQQVRGQGCLAADLDADGWTDLYLTTARSNVLLWNDGDGTFTADGGAAGMDTYGWQTAAASADVDGDGHRRLRQQHVADDQPDRGGVRRHGPEPECDLARRLHDGPRRRLQRRPDAGCRRSRDGQW